MILEGANKLFENDGYTIYTMNSVATGQYGVVVPKNINSVIDVIIDLHFKSSFDSVGSGIKTSDMLVNEINEEYEKLKIKYNNGMLVLPMVDEVNFQNALGTGDKQKLFDEVKRLSSITSELYKKLMDAGVSKQMIDQKIIIVEKTDVDSKFVPWLKQQMPNPNFVDGVIYSELGVQKEEVVPEVAPVVPNDLFGAPVGVETSSPIVEVSVAQPITGGSIDSTASVNPNVQPVISEPSVIQNGNSVENNPVGTVGQVETAVNVNEPVVQNQGVVGQSAGVNLFGETNTLQTASVNSVEPVPVVANNVQPAQTISNLGPIEGPKPVESTNLDKTMLFNPIPNNGVNNQSVADNNVDASELTDDPHKSSRGFVNLIVLVVILIVVTIVSIELGKFLYNVYGA